jgi:hypothetical protein
MVIRSDHPHAIELLRERAQAQGPTKKRALIEKRLEALQTAAPPPDDFVHGAWSVTWNSEICRVQVRGPKIQPTASKDRKPQAWGFVYSPKNRAWQRLANESAWMAAIEMVKKL